MALGTSDDVPKSSSSDPKSIEELINGDATVIGTENDEQKPLQEGLEAQSTKSQPLKKMETHTPINETDETPSENHISDETDKKPSENHTSNEADEKLSANHTSDETDKKPSENHTSDESDEKLSENDTSDETDKKASVTENAKETTDENLQDSVQDVGFNIQIISPNAEPLSIQVSSMELVQEIHQLLMDKEDTCHRTCFSLQLDGTTLDNFAELKSIEGLKEGSVVKVVEEPYTIREARIHVRHVRDLLKSMDPTDAYNGVDCYSLSFLNAITQGDLMEKKKTRPDSVDCTPPEYILPDAKEHPLLPLQPGAKNNKSPQCIKVLTTSAWNPPPGPRKLHGDLMYLYVITMEDKRFHITACPRGFYINQSTEETFNPKPESPGHLCHSLIDMLAQVSPAFKRNFAQMQKKRTLRHPFERVATPYQIYTWCSPSLDHTIDAIRAEDNSSSKLGYEEHIPGQTRDWNEELQTTRELSRKNLPDRLLRERAIFKVHSDFVTAATRGAMAVIDGNVMAINPGEDAKMQMFIWNNIFFSLGFDVRDHYKELGGDAAAFIAPKNDLHGVRVYNAIDVEGLYTLGTVVIDYRGYRVTAQSIIPGILEREQEQSVVYGSIDFGKTVLGHEKYLDLLKQAGQPLKIYPHSVLNQKSEPVELCSSVECKGIIGNDGRYYILDLLRTFPPDVNFLKDLRHELRENIRSSGFPIEHKHKLCCLRQELLDAFVEDRYIMFIKYAAFHLQKIISENKDKKLTAVDTKKEDEIPDENSTKETVEENVSESLTVTENNNVPAVGTGLPENNLLEKSSVNAADAKEIMKSFSDSISGDDKQAADSKDILRRACEAVGSLKEFEFDIRFNPDLYSAGINHVEPADKCASIEKQKQLIKDAAQFLVNVQIPNFIRDCLDHTAAPMDGSSLTEALHSRGINVRYLGKVVNALAPIKKLDYLLTISVQELIVRATRHVFFTYIQNTATMNLAVAISHFLNCFLMSGQTVTAPIQQDDMQKSNKKRNKRKPSKYSFLGCDNTEWTLLTQKSLWQQIRKELKSYWDFDLPIDSVEAALEQYQFHKLSLLRSFCLKTGIQIMLREYNFESKNKSTFNEDDIVNIFPIVKHVNPRASDAYNFYTTGQSKIQQGFFKEGFELISEALNLLNNVYGAMHSENAQCLRMLARLSYIMGDPQEALAIQQRAVLMSERVNGIDHPYTISEYAHLALYSFANSQISTALKLLYRARYLSLLICGDNHPEIALLDSNISLILHAVGEYELSLRFLEHALALNIKYYGEKSIKVAVSYHLVARTQSCMGDFRSALNSEKETYAIYKQQLGESHEKTKESSECLRHLTTQAVVLQKKMNDICSNGKLVADLPPIHIQPPSMDSVLDMLNAINGILFVQISPKDIANLKNEIEKRQKETDQTSTTDEIPELVAPLVNGHKIEAT